MAVPGELRGSDNQLRLVRRMGQGAKGPPAALGEVGFLEQGFEEVMLVDNRTNLKSPERL